MQQSQKNRGNLANPLIALTILCLHLGVTHAGTDESKNESTIVNIAFGSCIEDEKPNHPIWQSIIASQPRAMIFLGDNVYADTEQFRIEPSVEILKSEYRKLAATPGFQELKQTTEFHAIWDDHDYGLNDGGVEFELKEESQAIFMDFWDIPLDSERAKTPGTYGSAEYEIGPWNVQIVLLDTRFFRSPTVLVPPTERCPLKYWVPTEDQNATMLGETQWRWLEEKLSRPADLHILATGVQVLPTEHCWERWGTIPHERERLLGLIKSTGARVVILSGDRHLGDISMLAANAPNGVGYPLYEITSSPISARSGFGMGDPNEYRVSSDNVRQSNFGVLTFNVERATIGAELRDTVGSTVEAIWIYP